jgi:hypothetical protein
LSDAQQVHDAVAALSVVTDLVGGENPAGRASPPLLCSVMKSRRREHE